MKKCPSEDPFHDLKPLNFECPQCGSPYSIVSDELANRHHKCKSCGARIVDIALSRDDRTAKVMAFATSLGVSEVKIFASERIVVEDSFRENCKSPGCPFYGSSINCPPYEPTPAEFREHIKDFIHVVAFKFDFPMEAIHGNNHRESGKLLHETTAAVEHKAKEVGFERACGYSSGGCLATLCYDHANCSAIEEGGHCRHPRIARPSLSGQGVNWNTLSKILGWQMLKDENGNDNPDAKTVMMAGLVFLE